MDMKFKDQYYIRQGSKSGWTKEYMTPQLFVKEAHKLVPVFAMDLNKDTLDFLVILLKDAGYDAGVHDQNLDDFKWQNALNR